MGFSHVSVLLEECINGLNIKENGIYVDGTCGGAGHAFEIGKRLHEDGFLIGIDQDQDAIQASSKRLEGLTCRVELVKSNYESFPYIMDDLGLDHVDGVLLDLGVSSHQLDTDERGFSYIRNGLLDMRMDQEQEKTAADIVNEYEVQDLMRIFKIYGEERYAPAIARKIVERREEKPISTTHELVEIIEDAVPAKYRNAPGHPAKRTFQAIRIELNRELQVLEETLQSMIERLNDEGRLCVITFHSLEDRIVKNIFKENENPCTCPKNFPVCVCGKKPKGKMIPRKPILPSDEELEVNSRSRSAKLRIFVKREEH